MALPTPKITIDAHKLVASAIEKALGISAYLKIQDLFADTDVSSSEEFQRIFTTFYKIRCSAEWRRGYYKIFQKLRAKGTQLDIETILYELDEMCHTSRLDLSFASKMLHTINPDMPIWDRYIRDVLDFPPIPPRRAKNSLHIAIETYQCLNARMQGYLETEEVQREIQLLDSLIPIFRGISAMKKLDFFLWWKGWLGD